MRFATRGFVRSLFVWLCVSGCDAGATSHPSSGTPPATDDTWLRSGPAPVELHGRLSVVGTDLVDEHGSPVQLRGVSSMWLNYENDGYAEDPTALGWMRDHWNLDVIRAAMGVEPNGAYLGNPTRAKGQVQTIVANAIAAGVYVIIDWHDSHATQHQAQALQFFGEMATQYAGVPNVIYEPFNEPLSIDWTTEVKPYHEAVVAAIRAADPSNVIVLGTPNWSQDVDVAARAPLDGTNLMYALHFYACTQGGFLLAKAQIARGAGLPLFVTEWGATAADGGMNGVVCLSPATSWMNWLNGANISWTSWKLDNCEPDSSCLLTPDAPVAGGWDSRYLHGHAQFVRDAMRQ